jgi:hypothetical protein
MPLTISTTNAPATTPLTETPARLQELAEEHGDVGPNGGVPVAITIPVIVSDQTGLQYHTRNSDAEYRFNTGTLSLTLRQQIHVSSALSPCARAVWLQHEAKHLRDNERVMTQMDAALRRNPEIIFHLIHPTWQNISHVSAYATNNLGCGR